MTNLNSHTKIILACTSYSAWFLPIRMCMSLDHPIRLSFCVMQAMQEGLRSRLSNMLHFNYTYPLRTWLMIVRTFCRIHVHLGILCACVNLWAWHSSSPWSSRATPVDRSTPVNSHSRNEGSAFSRWRSRSRFRSHKFQRSPPTLTWSHTEVREGLQRPQTS